MLAEVGPPVENREYVTGRPPYTPESMFLTNLLRLYLKMSYRELESFLRDNEQMRRRLGLQDAPGRDTINRYAMTIREEYLREFNDKLNARAKKGGVAFQQTLPVCRSSGTRSVGTLPQSPTGRNS